MKRFDLAVAAREGNGKGPSRQLRFAGRIPGVIYGAGEPQKVSLDYREFERLIKGGAEKALLDLRDSASGVAILREIQRDPVTRRYLHVDLYSIRMDQETVFEVAVQASGIPVGVREGGILETHLRTVSVRCMPANLPTMFEVDIVGLKSGDTLHVRDLPLPDGVTIVTDPVEVLFTVTTVRGEKTAEAAEGAAQPEVIGKKKEDDKAGKK